MLGYPSIKLLQMIWCNDINVRVHYSIDNTHVVIHEQDTVNDWNLTVAAINFNLVRIWECKDISQLNL